MTAIICLRTAVWSCGSVRSPLRYARDLSESQPVKETTPVGSRKPSPPGFGQYGVKVLPETAGLGGGKGSLGHTGGLSTVTTGRFTFLQVLPALPSRVRQTCADYLGELEPLFSKP